MIEVGLPGVGFRNRTAASKITGGITGQIAWIGSRYKKQLQRSVFQDWSPGWSWGLSITRSDLQGQSRTSKKDGFFSLMLGFLKPYSIQG